jgi:hypothetical protein
MDDLFESWKLSSVLDSPYYAGKTKAGTKELLEAQPQERVQGRGWMTTKVLFFILFLRFFVWALLGASTSGED